MENSYPQYPESGNPNQPNQQQGPFDQAGTGSGQGAANPLGTDAGGESFGPAFGPFDTGAADQQPTQTSQAPRAGHFGDQGAQGAYPTPGSTRQYPAQNAYQQGYQQARSAAQAPQAQPTQPRYQQASPYAQSQPQAQHQPYGYQQQGNQPQQAHPYQQAQQPQQAQHTQAQPTQPQQPAQAPQGRSQAPVQPAQLRREPPREGTRTAERKQHVGLKAAACGLLGGVLGSAGVVWALTATNVIGTNKVVTQESSAGQTISIAAQTEDATIAEAVAAKALPSVCSVYVATATGEGMGSGVVLDTDGNILTNYHVAGDATELSVLIGGKNYPATYVGGDPSSDLAVIHAELGGDAVTPMEIGDSDSLVVGDWVMTIGSPFGLDQSVSAGIVSSLARNTTMSSTTGTTLYANLIQTDAMINPGNSGGALVNEKGQLVGISTLFSSDTGNFSGIGYAIPGNYALDIANKIIAGEQVTHAYIGLSMQTVNAQNARANKLSVDQGAYVAQVAEGGPAEAAGIEEGDIITKIGDTDILSADGAILAVRSHTIGETVKVTVMRGTEEKTFDVTLASDERLQELQQQMLEQQQQQQQQYFQQYQMDGNGFGNGYTDEELLEQLYDYLYNNRR